MRVSPFVRFTTLASSAVEKCKSVIATCLLWPKLNRRREKMRRVGHTRSVRRASGFVLVGKPSMCLWKASP
jgi:hypothetical protein